MKHSELIREAKKELWNGVGDFNLSTHCVHVCYCLDRVARRATESDIKKIKQIKKSIQKAIGTITIFGKPTNLTKSVEDWLDSRGFGASSVHIKWRQDYRARWMDAMINQYEREGK